MSKTQQIHHIRKNLKFIYLFAATACGISLITQFTSIKMQETTQKLTQEIVNTESRISEYRNFLWLLHMKTDSVSEIFSEFQDVQRNQELIEIPLIDNHFEMIQPKISKLGVKTFMEEHEHRDCLEVMRSSRRYIEITRDLKKTTYQSNQYQEYLIEKSSLGLSVMSFFLFIYGYIHARNTK